MPANAKLFRAIVVMGASLTAGVVASCDDRCHRCEPSDANETLADGRIVDATPHDAGVDTPGPRDAEVDTVLIL